jgi:dipeptidyl-peptidase-4
MIQFRSSTLLRVLVPLLFSLAPAPLRSQVNPAPGGALTAADYQRAERFLVANTQPRVFRADVTPQWLDGDRFWYRVRVPGGFEFVSVDPARGSRSRAFDHEGVAAALSRSTGQSYTALELPFSTFALASDRRSLEVTVAGVRWRCDPEGVQCAILEAGPRDPAGGGIVSPDGRYVAFRREHDLWVFDREARAEIRLTTDGAPGYGYGTDSQGWRQGTLPILAWSPDSRKIATFRLDERGVELMHLLQTAEPRPRLQSWPYALPSDSIVPMVERVVIDVMGRRVIELETPPDHQRSSSCCGMARGQTWADVQWGADGQTLAFVSVSRDYRTATLRVADAESGAVRTVLSESHPRFFESHVASGGLPNWRILPESGEFLWFSQRDGWGHVFLYDLETGAMKGRVTGGAWNVLDVLRVDPARRTLHFTAVGREPGQDPYHRHLYRVALDGTGLRRLTEGEADHEIFLSPTGAHFVERASTVSTPPITRLRRADDGRLVRELEVADVSELEAMGWRAPESFVARGRDGVTEIHGILIRPSHFDPSKRYPIVNAIYPGPQTGSVGTRSFSVSRRGQAHALAELGFIVVLVDAMGTPLRSKAFHTAYYGDMGDNGLPDQIAVMRELAQRHAWIDLDRVGIYGHSGGGYATAAALLRHPDFFHVGVAGAGNHDNAGYTFYWGEKYQGPFERRADGSTSYDGQSNHGLAANLKGKLLITWGTMDNNVHPNPSLLLVDALIRENRDFDLLVLPNRGHGYGNEPYVMRRTWDYFVEHLMGKTPPVGYRIGG